jgi:cholesterol oxidase
MLTANLVEGGGRIPRPLRFLLILLHPLTFLRSSTSAAGPNAPIILLVMQSLDNSLTTYRKKGLFGAFLSTRSRGTATPTLVDPAGRRGRQARRRRHGRGAFGSIFEATLDVPTTAHIIGGCPIGDSSETGVIDPYHRMFGYDGLHVATGPRSRPTSASTRR